MCGMRRISDDRGYALPVVLGIMMVAFIIGFALIALSMNVLNNAGTMESDSQAFQAASAGLDAALADMQANSLQPSHFPMRPPEGVTVAGGTYVVTAEALGNTEYRVVSVGQAADGTVETIVNRFFYMNLWSMNLAVGSDQSLVSGSSGLHGNTSVHGPLYIRGSVTFPSDSQYSEGPLFIRDGDVATQGSGTVGTSAESIDVYVTGIHPAAGSKGWYVKKVSSSVPVITLPAMTVTYLTAMHDKAVNESTDNIMGTAGKSSTPNHEATNGNPATYTTINPPNAGGWTRTRAAGASTYYKVIGNASTVGTLNGGTSSLTVGGTGSWGSWYGDGHTTVQGEHDDFAFNDATNTLYVEGTVYVDGDLFLNGGINYVGNGTIVANGDITISGQLLPLGGEMSSSAVLGLAAAGDIHLNCGGGNVAHPTDTTPADISGAFFSNGTINFNNHFVFRGSCIAGGLSFNANNAHLITNPLLPTFLPDSLPGIGTNIMAASSWSRQ